MQDHLKKFRKIITVKKIPNFIPNTIHMIKLNIAYKGKGALCRIHRRNTLMEMLRFFFFREMEYI